MIRIVHGTNSPGGYEQSTVRTVQGTNSPSMVRIVQGTNSPRYEKSRYPIPDPLWPPLPRDWGFISGTGKVTDFKFCGYIYKANPNKNPFKFWRKGSLGVFRDCPNFWEVIEPNTLNFRPNFKFSRLIFFFGGGGPSTPLWVLSHERVKLRTSNFEGTFKGSIGTKAHEKCWE